MRKRIFFEERSEKYDPVHPRDPALVSLFGGGTSNSSKVNISEHTANTITAVFSAVNIISESISMLPWCVYRQKRDNSRELALNDSRYKLLKYQPNRWQNSLEFREMMVNHLCYTGRFVAELIYDVGGKLTDIMPLQPNTYIPFRAPNGTIAMEVTSDNGKKRVLMHDEYLDVRGTPSLIDPLYCVSPIKASAESLGIAKAADMYAGSFFGNGTVVSGVLETDATLSSAAYQRLKKWTERHQGVGRTHNPAILEEGLKWKQTSLNAEDAQLLQTRKYQVEDIARIYRIPAYKLGVMENVKFNTVEQQSIDFVTDTLLPRTERIEQAVARAIFTPSEITRLVNEIDLNGLMRGDSKTRSEYYQKRWQMGSMSPNEIRARESENPIENGDLYYYPVNYSPVGSMVEEASAQEPQRDFTPLIRSVFDRIISAQCKIFERCATNEEHLTRDMSKNKAFIDRNMTPLVEIFGEECRNWFDSYYVNTLREIEENRRDCAPLADILADWREKRLDNDLQLFKKDMGIL